MKQVAHAPTNRSARIRATLAPIALSAMLLAPSLALAAPGAEAAGRVTTFFTNINGLLNIASIAIVTIAIIFAGYQIAFNHKRIGDVAPVLIGGFLIGAAAQIAKMLLPDTELGAIGGGMALALVDLVARHA
ncbi:TrbC/VirB2 family protein [Luteimonas kalidii]|uniref:TrbC/VirB2 family protein n=1 Tax=Luteimonas kalidii TaxID=3042025 RepID=A0ABT6JVP4_9GAMM|nr:TrbC/VirB2 family protein [Luteimonas kalidii]MDH5834568.1 TrbC/VirB2 family protein [Luteimonas kalidii]